MPIKKIVCMGAGSLYFGRAITDLLVTPGLAGSALSLYDLDGEKARLVAARGQTLADQAGTGWQVRAAATLAEALEGADFVVSSIGGSGAEITPNVYGSYYHWSDLSIPVKYGIYQVVGDTGGPAGMMMGLRSIPAYLGLCREMEKRCPRALVFNHSNPMAPICRAMRKYTSINFIGICHGVQGGICHAAHHLGVPPTELECTWIGTNHYYWFLRVCHQGRDVYPELRRRLAAKVPEGTELSSHLSRIYEYQIVYPPDDHVWEFYAFGATTRTFAELPAHLRHAAQVHGYTPDLPEPRRYDPKDQAARQAFLTRYRELVEGMQLPAAPDNSVTGEGLGALLSAIANGQRHLAIVNVPNDGLIPNLPPTALIEVEGVTDSQGVRGIQVGTAPLVLKGLLEKRFVWQELVADAGVKGERNLALQALMMDEMAILPERAEAMLDELLAASRELLPQFRR